MRVVMSFVAMACLLAMPMFAQQKDVPDGPSTQAIVPVIFAQPPPPSCFDFPFSLAATQDVSPGGADCCIPDDTVEVYIDGCLVGTMDSRIVGNAFTRVGPVTVPAGSSHVVTYCNTVSDTLGPSGWNLDDLNPPPLDAFSAPTGTNACRPVQVAVIEAVDELGAYKNHGDYVSAATAALKATGVAVSAECQSCIINQFARRIPQASMTVCCGL